MKVDILLKTFFFTMMESYFFPSLALLKWSVVLPKERIFVPGIAFEKMYKKINRH